MKASVVVLSFGFAVLGLIGVATHAPPWISWLSVVGGLLGSTLAIAIPDARRRFEPYVAVGVGTYAAALWIAAMVSAHGGSMTKWMMAFAIGFFATAAVAFSVRTAGRAEA